MYTDRERSGKGLAQLLLLCTLLSLCGHSAQSAELTAIAGKTTTGAATAATFTTSLSTDGGSTFTDTAGKTQTVSFTGTIKPDPGDVNQLADIFVVVRANRTFYMRKPSGGYVLWDGKVPSLQPFREDVLLASNVSVDVFTGVLNLVADLEIFLGYMTKTGSALVYSPLPTVFTITATSVPPATETTDGFYTPAPIVAALEQTRSLVWLKLDSAVKDLLRFAMGPADSTDVVVLTDTGNAVDAQLSVASGLAAQSAQKDGILLRSMFKFIEESSGTYRIVSTKHSNYALDVASAADSSTVILRDVRSGYIDVDTAAYLTFSVSQGENVTLTASGRKIYDSASQSFVADTNWQSRQLVVTQNGLGLTAGSGTALNLYVAPINFSIPFDFNPEAIARVSNPEVTPVIRAEDKVATTPQQVVSKYADQLVVAGPDAGTTAAATQMLTEIESSLAAEGMQLRYPKELYLAFRAGLQARIVQSSDSTDGSIGQYAVPYVYFTNEMDNADKHHPFMVIASYGLPDSLALLWDVPKPPGGDCGSDPACQPNDYSTQSVTRSFHREAFLMKIPLRDYGEVTSLSENIMLASLASDEGVTALDHHNNASVSATGVAVDGVIIYPSYNNSLHVSQTAAELSAHGMHSGRGLGVHYHADAHSATGEGLNLYNEEDYAGHTHPPLVSMGFDGVAGYGVYRAGDSSSEGAGLALDEFGGHEHGVYGYHYHAYREEALTEAGPGGTGGMIPYTVHTLPPHGAWAGRINDIPEFWGMRAPEYVGGRSVYLGTE